MNEVLGATVTLALGVAISPVPVIATILMLLSPRAGRTSTTFLLGWLVGITAAISLTTALGTLIPAGDGGDGGRPVVAAVQALLGVGLLALAARQWRDRPGPRDEPALPEWMTSFTSVSAAKAFGLGALLSAANPKNLLLAAGAGVTFSQADLPTGSMVASIVIWVLIAASTVAIPVVGALSMPDRVAAPLGRLKTWLATNNAAVMCVLLLVIGVNLLGKAIGQA